MVFRPRSAAQDSSHSASCQTAESRIRAARRSGNLKCVLAIALSGNHINGIWRFCLNVSHSTTQAPNTVLLTRICIRFFRKFSNFNLPPSPPRRWNSTEAFRPCVSILQWANSMLIKTGLFIDCTSTMRLNLQNFSSAELAASTKRFVIQTTLTNYVIESMKPQRVTYRLLMGSVLIGRPVRPFHGPDNTPIISPYRTCGGRSKRKLCNSASRSAWERLLA